MIVSFPRWLRRWDRLTESKPDLQSPQDRRKARALASLLLILIPLLLIDLITAYTLNRSPIPYGFTLLLVGAYILSRTRLFRQGGLVALLALFLRSVCRSCRSQPL